MTSRFIFRSQLNEFLKVLIDSKLGIESFHFDSDLSKTDLKIALPIRAVHRLSGFYFGAGFTLDDYKKPDYFSIVLCPGKTPDEEKEYSRDWLVVVKYLQTWVATVEKETSEPDPWSLLNEGHVLKDQIPTGGQETFNETELKRVKQHLANVRQFLVENVNPNQEQLKLIDERLSYLEQSARRQSKQDWAHTAVGVMFTIAIGLAMAPDQANKLFQFTAQFLQTLFIKLLP